MKRLILSVWICCLGLGLTAAVLVTDIVKTDEVLTKALVLQPLFPTDAYANYQFLTSASSASDSSTNGFTVVKTGVTWRNATYAYANGGCMYFDGKGAFLTVTNKLELAAFPAWEQYSVSIWFKHDGKGTIGQHHMLFDKSASDTVCMLSLDNGTCFPGAPDYAPLVFWLYDEGIDQMIFLSTDAIWNFGVYPEGTDEADYEPFDYRDNQWHHVVVVRNGPVGELWVDGRLNDSTANGWWDDMFNVTNASNLYFGRCSPWYEAASSSTVVSWSGMMDEIQIFDRALSARDIVNLFQRGTPIEPLTAVAVPASLAIQGELTVTGQVSCVGTTYLRPMGDLSCGDFTNSPALQP